MATFKQSLKQAGGRVGAALGKAKPYAARIILVVVALIVCALPPIFVNDAIGYLPLLALVFALILSFVYLQLLKRSFSFSEASLAPSCERGSVIDFVLEFKNASPLVFVRLEPYIYISDLFDDVDTVTPVSLTLMPHETREFSFQAKFDHIGTYAAGVQKIIIYDLFGLFTHTIVNDSRHKVEVLPRLIDIENMPLSSEVSSESQKPRQTLTVDDMDYAGVREYAWGDPIKTIHWKLSARNPSGDYLTRLFESYNNPGISIILDTTAPGYTSDELMYIFDGVVESALSVNRFAVSQGVDSVLQFRNRYGEDCKFRMRKQGDDGELIRVLPRIKAAEGTEARDILRRETNTLHGEDNVAFCTSQLSEDTISMLITLKMRKRNPLLFFVVPPDMEDAQVRELTRPLRRLDEAQIPRYVISAAGDLGVERGGE